MVLLVSSRTGGPDHKDHRFRFANYLLDLPVYGPCGTECCCSLPVNYGLIDPWNMWELDVPCGNSVQFLNASLFDAAVQEAQ